MESNPPPGAPVAASPSVETPPSEPPADSAGIPRHLSHLSDREFASFPISPEILHGIEELGWHRATHVQAEAIEPALAGRDLVVRSKTGTGKTGAFSIPMVERIAAGDRKTRAIVLCPTRELALQVATECAAVAKYKDLRVVAIYGGVGMGPQEDALRAGAEVVVGTPGRVLDHIRRRNLDLSEAAFACLDEADEMLSMGFFEDVTRILDRTPAGRQVLLFSATVDERVAGLVSKYLRDPLDVRLSTDADRVEGITHVIYETRPDFHKARALLAILDQEQPKSAILFCNTREDAATLSNFLEGQGLDTELLSGDLPQSKREQVMGRVKRGETQFLVATDVAARGIDISDLSHVIHYSLPEDPALYLHRSGRTARVGKTGISIGLAGGSDMSTRKVLETTYAIPFEERPMPTPEEASRARVDRQVQAIRTAMGSMAFEGYIGTVRALRERPDGDLLLAAALRAFFLWDRMRKAREDGEPEFEPDRNGGRERYGRDRGGRDGPGDGGGRNRRGGRGGGWGERREPRDRGFERERREPRRTETVREVAPGPTESEEPARENSADSMGGGPGAGSQDGPGRRRRRRRRRGGRGGPPGSEGNGEGGGAGGDSSSGPSSGVPQ